MTYHVHFLVNDQIKEIEQEAHTRPDREIQQVLKQNAAVDLAKRLRDRAMNDASSQQGDYLCFVFRTG